MCLSNTDNPPYKCCCGCPLICGVIIIAVYEVFNLLGAIQFLDIGGIIVSSILIIGFLISFVKRDSQFIRNSLLYTYGISLILFLINVFLYIWQNSIDSLCTQACRGIDHIVDWDQCLDDMETWIWIFIAVYVFIILMVRIFFVRILYYYAKEAEHRNPAYQQLDGHARDSKPSHNI